MGMHRQARGSGAADVADLPPPTIWRTDMTSESVDSRQPTPQTEPRAPRADATDRIEARVDELLSTMTPAEKAGQLTQYFYFQLPAETEGEPALGLDVQAQPLMVEAALGRGEAGSLLFMTDPAELQRLAVEGNRLGIPLLFGFDVIHGLRTIFPVPIAMAASWDLETIERGQAVAAREARAVGIHWTFAPMVDIARDPRWGRTVEGGAGNVMTAYMDLNGVPASGSRWLFTDVLRDTWGFAGFVVSDANALRNLVIHGFAADLTDAGTRAVTAGVDMEMAVSDPAYAHLPDALQSGAVSEDVIDSRVRRTLEAKLRLGLFDDPYVDEDHAREVLADPDHREVARIAAERSPVLLRNEGTLLPLDVEQLGAIAVIGPLADSKRDTLGPWVFDFDLDETVTVLDGIRRTVGERVRVDSARGIPVVQRVFPSMFDMFGRNRPADPEGFDEEAEFARVAEVADAADVAVVVVGEWQNMIGEAASRSSLELPGRQLELLQAVVATGTPTVLLVMNGRPLDLRWAAENVPAILDIWYPGTQGGAAVADLLFGTVSPSGKLPFSWPRTVGQVPMIYSHTS